MSVGAIDAHQGSLCFEKKPRRPRRKRTVFAIENHGPYPSSGAELAVPAPKIGRTPSQSPTDSQPWPCPALCLPGVRGSRQEEESLACSGDWPWSLGWAGLLSLWGGTEIYVGPWKMPLCSTAWGGDGCVSAATPVWEGCRHSVPGVTPPGEHPWPAQVRLGSGSLEWLSQCELEHLAPTWAQQRC